TLPQEGAFGWSSHAIDLGDFVGDRRGPVLVEVAPGRIAPRGRGRPVPEAVRQVYQVTGLGLSGMTSLPRSIARVTRLPDQAPVPGARVVRWTTKGAQEIARTDAQGRVELGSMREWSPDAVIEVVKKDDRLVYDARPHGKKSKPTGATIDPHERVLASV